MARHTAAWSSCRVPREFHSVLRSTTTISSNACPPGVPRYVENRHVGILQRTSFQQSIALLGVQQRVLV